MYSPSTTGHHIKERQPKAFIKVTLKIPNGFKINGAKKLSPVKCSQALVFGVPMGKVFKSALEFIFTFSA